MSDKYNGPQSDPGRTEVDHKLKGILDLIDKKMNLLLTELGRSEIKIVSNLSRWVMLIVLLFLFMLHTILAIFTGFGIATIWMLHSTPKIEKYHAPSNNEVDTIKHKDPKKKR